MIARTHTHTQEEEAEEEVCVSNTPIASPPALDSQVSARKINAKGVYVHRMVTYGCTRNTHTQEEEAKEEEVCVRAAPIASPPALDSKVSAYTTTTEVSARACECSRTHARVRFCSRRRGKRRRRRRRRCVRVPLQSLRRQRVTPRSVHAPCTHSCM